MSRLDSESSKFLVRANRKNRQRLPLSVPGKKTSGSAPLSFESLESRQMLAADAERLGDLSGRQAALAECLERLPPAQRELLAQCYAGDASIESLACGLGRTFNAVRQSLFRIRKSLYRCVEQRLANSQSS